MLIDTLNCMHDTPIITHLQPACQHPSTITYLNLQNCAHCGSFIFQSPTSNTIRSFKLPRGVKTRLEISPSLIYDSMLKSEKEGNNPNPAYIKVLYLYRQGKH